MCNSHCGTLMDHLEIKRSISVHINKESVCSVVNVGFPCVSFPSLLIIATSKTLQMQQQQQKVQTENGRLNEEKCKLILPDSWRISLLDSLVCHCNNSSVQLTETTFRANIIKRTAVCCTQLLFSTFHLSATDTTLAPPINIHCVD